MDKDLNNMLKGLHNMQNQTKDLINQGLTPEMMDSFSIEEKEMINEAKKGLDFSGKDSLSSRITKITQTLQKNGM